MKTLYETIVEYSLDESILDGSDQQKSISEQHPQVILDVVRKILWDCFGEHLDLGYPIETSYSFWQGFRYGEMEIGNIQSPSALKKKVIAFISKLNQVGFDIPKKPREDKYADEIHYSVCPVEKLTIEFTASKEDGGYYIIYAPKYMLQ